MENYSQLVHQLLINDLIRIETNNGIFIKSEQSFFTKEEKEELENKNFSIPDILAGHIFPNEENRSADYFQPFIIIEGNLKLAEVKLKKWEIGFEVLRIGNLKCISIGIETGNRIGLLELESIIKETDSINYAGKLPDGFLVLKFN